MRNQGARAAEQSTLWFVVCGACVAISCAGRASRASAEDVADSGPAQAGERTAPLVSEGDAGAAELGGSAGNTDESGRGGARDGRASDAGASGADGGSAGRGDALPPEPDSVARRAESGTHLCLDNVDCDDTLSCVPSAGRARLACLAPCETDADCKHSERCFAQPSIQKSCFQRCDESFTQCEFQFDCADYYRRDEYSCIPSEWVRNWPPSDPAGS